jgi:hypothetical protein
MMRGPARRVALGVALIVLLAACANPATPVASSHALHDPQADRVRAAMESDLGVTFEPAGPHHVLGRAPDGTEIDLVGVPVEEVVLSAPIGDLQAGLDYLPHIRDLLHGPGPVYDWVADMLACRTDAAGRCQTRFEQGNLVAEFTSEGPAFVVLSISRGRSDSAASP